ncbi:hypothetical protein EIN_281930 [Entamoeba invadens IP1]|uniref:Uncharacterized protein n=1 Tax=Entamoeba invadens IP1 TaxID=370355 RepID=A0A0A1TX42_ENTIV|nr:hypothetical protein EIN_281930 [Entamoeba invadens IP1]ELP85822.1 hypothetical protein EIN_281930 [Entamoeba invadens IP1]|eukprot:XP_004185168.1 hypothetical protein EIN_281930 [Entamoeba invadens IP1]
MTSETTETMKLCDSVKVMIKEIVQQFELVKKQPDPESFKQSRESFTLKIGDIANLVTMTNKSDYTERELESLQTVVLLAHLLYEVSKTWVFEKSVDQEIEQKISYLETNTTKLNNIAKEEATKKKIDVMGEVTKHVDTGKGKNINKELEKFGIKEASVTLAISEARAKVVEYRKKQEDANKALEKLYTLLEPAKGQWTKEDFIKTAFGEKTQPAAN